LALTGGNEMLRSDVARLAQGGAVVFIAGLVGRGLLYAYEMLCSRTLGQDFYGLLGLGLATVTVVGGLARFGMDSTAVKFVAGHRARGQRQAAKGAAIFTLTAAAIGGLVVGGVLSASAGALARVFDKPDAAGAIRWLAWAMPFGAVFWVGLALAQAYRIARYELYVRSLLWPGLLFALTFAVFAAGGRLGAAVGAYLAASVLVAAATLLVAGRSLGAFDGSIKAEWRLGSWLAYAAPVAVLPFLKTLLVWTDTFVLAAFRPSADVGVYRACMQTAMMTSLVLAATNRMFAPMISQMASSGRRADLAETFPVVARWVLAFSVPVFVLLAVFPDRFCDLFKVDAAAGAVALVILAAAQLVNCAAGSAGQLLLMAGYEKVVLYNTVGIFVLNLVLNLIFVPRYGITGAAAATAAGVCVDNLVKLIGVRILAGTTPFSRAMAKPALAGLAAFGVALAARHFLPGRWLPFLVGAAALASVYGSVTVFLGFDGHDRTVLGAVGLGWICGRKTGR